MRLYLKIGREFKQMKMDEGSVIAMNFTHDNLENPTNYVSENSYSLKLPRCPENNKLFSNFLHLDSVIVSGGYDPTERMDYIAMSDEGEVVSTGTAVVKSIERDGYKLSLLGSLSHIFTKLLNAGFDTDKAAESDAYYLMTDWLKKKKVWLGYRYILQDGENYINTRLVYTSWMVDHPQFYPFTMFLRLKMMYGLIEDNNVSETDAFIASIIGFAPTAQGNYKDFDGEMWMDGGYVRDGAVEQDITALPVLKRHRDLMGEMTEGFDVEGDLCEAQIGEFRSYYQQPYIYISALWQMFQMEFPDITNGYNLDLDSRWFNIESDELQGLVYMLPQIYRESSPIGTRTSLPDMIATKNLPAASYASKRWQDGVLVVSGLNASASVASSGITLLKGERITFSYKAEVILDIKGGTPGQTIYFSNYNMISCAVNVLGSNIGTGINSKKYGLLMTTNRWDRKYFTNESLWDGNQADLISISMKNGAEIATPTYTPFDGGTQTRIQMFVTGDEVSVVALENTTVQLAFGAGFVDNQGHSPFGMSDGNGNLLWQWYNCPTAPQITYRLTEISYTKSTNWRSNSVVSLERLFGNIKPFSVLLQHSKANHLLWMVDDDTKTVTVKRASDAYADMVSEGITNVTDRVANDKGMKISPISWDSHSVQFNLTPTDTDYTEGYEDRVGITYGSKRIITQNNIHDTDRKLLGSGENDTIKSSAMLSMTVAPVSSIMAATQKQFFVEVPPMPLNIRGGESADVYGNFYYRHGNGLWSDKVLAGWRDAVYITDDLVKEITYNRYCWHGISAIDWFAQYGYSVMCAERPVFKTMSYNGLSVLFAAVREQYTGAPDEPTEYMYEHCWKDYVEEVYNQQNKTVELYMNISNALLAKLRRNPLVQIGNCIYLLMEIKDWSERSRICKCRLRQIYDLNKLTGQQ